MLAVRRDVVHPPAAPLQKSLDRQRRGGPDGGRGPQSDWDDIELRIVSVEEDFFAVGRPDRPSWRDPHAKTIRRERLDEDVARASLA